MGVERYAAGWHRAGDVFRLLVFIVAWLGATTTTFAQDVDTTRQSLDAAWWTGPMLANSAATLPRGHILIEPYFYDVMSKGADSFGSRAYVLYGLTDRLTVGLIPIIGYNRVRGGANSSGIGLGDQILQTQYRLRRFHAGSWLPTISLQLQETVPTGRYDRLARPSDGMGEGAWATTLGLNAQSYFWMPDGRILRVRLNLTKTFARHVDVNGVSVYGTGRGFRGHAMPGNAFHAGTSFEYSLTRRWVLALDVIYNHNDATRVAGYDDSPGFPPSLIHTASASSDAFGYAPAVEYSFSSTLGVLLGVRVITGGYNTPRSVTPAIAINYVH